MPIIPETPAIPSLPSVPKFQWLQRIIFPGIQLAVFGCGFYIMFAVISAQTTFNMGYLIGFMALGMIASLICGVIEFVIEKNAHKKKYAELKGKFLEELKKCSDTSIVVGSEYLERIDAAYPTKMPLDMGLVSQLLWERTYDEPIYVRVGKIERGANPAAISFKQDISKHPLYESISSAMANCATLSNIPYLFDCLRYHSVAIIGEYADSFTQALISDVVCNYSPERVHIHCVAEADNAEFELLSQLPHVQKSDNLIFSLTHLTLADDGKMHLVWVSGNMVSKISDIIRIVPDMKSKVLLLIENPIEPPAFCDCCIDVYNNNRAKIMEHFTVVDTIIPELIEFGEFSKIVKYVSRFCMNDTKTGDSNYKFNRLPDKLTLYDFLEINSAAEWDFPQKDVSEKGLEIPIGLGANGKKVILNFTSCRGHGILAGMTGSGKSQFLLSMIVLLSLKYKPDFFSFAIIDFKADASAMQLRELPNFVGALSDLDDESQLNRALVMLDCESKRRQKILNDAKKNAVIAVNEIEYYHQAQRLGKKLEALPYLLVIVDEFVDAKRSDPNFLEKMACIARQGRSRGIYLLLAAQNPSSEIGGQIAANVGYNICFKVRDDAISTAVIKNSIAADIDSKLRGRGYLLTDVDGLIEFQTPYCGEEVVCQGIASTQLEEIISVLKQQKLSLPRRIFEEPLPTEIVPTKECLRSFDIDSATADVLIPVGWGDNIYAAKMELFSIPFSNGNVMVFGNPGTGKTTLMQTILFMGCARYSPEDLQFVVCAFGDSSLRQFEKLPHVRSVISFEDIELLQRLPARLKREVDIRKAVKVKRPTLVILIDRMESLVQECLEIAEQITELSSISFKYNIFFVFSSIRHNILSSDKRQSIKTWIGFQTDNEPYSNYMPLREVKKPTAVPGRSLSYINGSATIETQFFVVDRFGISINENIKKLKEKIDIIADYYDHPSTAFDIETIPEPVSSREIEDCDSSILPLGLRWEYSFGPDGYHFTDSPFFVVSGYSQMEVILGRMAIFAAATDNFRVDSVYFCNPNIRMFAKELSDNHKIKCYGDDLLQDFFEAVRDLFVKPPANHSFVFINLLSLLESKAQTSEDTRQHYQTFVKELREQSSQLLCKKIHFVISDYAGLLVPNRTLSSVLFATNQYAHGIICGGTTKNRIGAEALRGESQIPEGFGYLYGSGNSLTLVKLQNRD